MAREFMFCALLRVTCHDRKQNTSKLSDISEKMIDVYLQDGRIEDCKQKKKFKNKLSQNSEILSQSVDLETIAFYSDPCFLKYMTVHVTYVTV